MFPCVPQLAVDLCLKGCMMDLSQIRAGTGNRNIKFKTCKAKATRREMLKLTHKAGGNCRVRQFFSVGSSLGAAAFTSKES